MTVVMSEKMAKEMEVVRDLNRNDILEHVFPAFCNCKQKYPENTTILLDEYLDMTVKYVVPFRNMKDAYVSVLITSTILNEYKITEQELKTAAYQNIKPDIRPMYEYLKDYGMIDMLHGNDMLIVSNNSHWHGATSIILENVLQDVEEMIGRKTAILPSSVHECIAVPYEDESDLYEYQKMVKEVNDTCVSEEERLTDSVYIIDDGKLELAKQKESMTMTQ